MKRKLRTKHELEHLVSNTSFSKVGEKTVVCIITTVDGFEIVGSSSCISPEDFAIKKGEFWAEQHAMRELEKYEAYSTHKKRGRPVKTIVDDQLVVAVDFDGTITTEEDMGHELMLRDNCYEVLHRLHDKNVKLILWTCRSGKVLTEALNFLENSHLLQLFSSVNKQLPEIEEKYFPDVAAKVGVDFYIDDRNIMSEIDWLEIEDHLDRVITTNSLPTNGV